MPIETDMLRQLQVGDIVYVSGFCHTMRDMGHRRSVELIRQNESLPFNVKEGVLWHCGPVVRKEAENWRVVSAGSTTSSRFTELGAELIREMKIRFTIGKGTMGAKAVEAMRETGACYLNAIGGCAALYSEQVKRVKEVYWTDLGLPEAIWVLEVDRLGPLVVGIDSHGKSLFENIRGTMQSHLEEVYRSLGLESTHNYSYLPRHIPGKSSGPFSARVP